MKFSRKKKNFGDRQIPAVRIEDDMYLKIEQIQKYYNLTTFSAVMRLVTKEGVIAILSNIIAEEETILFSNTNVEVKKTLNNV